MAGYRPSYTHEEEKQMVDYIIERNEYHRLKGDKLWKLMEQDLALDRTWQSLKQHFRKRMIDSLHYPHYKLSQQDQEKIRTFYYRNDGQREQQPRRLSPLPRPGRAENSQASRPAPKVTVDVETGRRIPNFMASSSSSSSSSDSDR